MKWAFAGNLSHQCGQAEVFAYGGLRLELHSGVLLSQRVYQYGQIFTGVLSRTQEHGDDCDLGCAFADEFVARLRQCGGAKLQISASHVAARVLGPDKGCHSFYRCPPQRVPRAVGKENDCVAHLQKPLTWRQRLSTSQPKAASDSTE